MSLGRHIEILVQDLRHAARGFRRAPMFAFTAIFAVALGVGSGTGVFSVVDRILFRSLPYADSDRLVSFGMVAPIAPQEFMLGYDYLDWRDAQTPFESLSYWTSVNDCDLTDRDPVRVRCGNIDAALLPTLGVQPILGRNFSPRDNLPNAAKVALLSYGLWQSRFGGDPNVVGKSVPLDGRAATVAGVLPLQFELPALEPADVLVPQTLDETEQRTRRTATLLWTVGRLKPGVGLEQARAALQPLFEKSLQGVPPGFRKDVKLRLRSLRDRQIQDSRLASWILMASVLAVLLIACANVANLLLARAASRQRELAVRSALGAGGGRLARQALTESLLLALLGGAAGTALALLFLRLFVAIAPQGIPRLNQAGVDARVLLFALALSVVSGVVFGLAPALQHPRVEAITGWRAIGARRQWFRHSLVAAQICISLVLLTGASLLLRSLWNLQNQPLGMRTPSLLTAQLSLGRNSHPDAARRTAFFDELEANLRRLPGVTELAISDSAPPLRPLMAMTLYATIDVEGRPPMTGSTGGTVVRRSVTPGYFATLGIPILRGRGFREEDRDPNQDAIILSDSLARRMFPGEDPLFKRIRPGRTGPWHTVVGVAGNVKNSALHERDDPEFYQVRKRAPAPAGRDATAILRTALDPRAMAGALRAEISALDPALPVTLETMDQRLGKLAQRPRFNALLLAIFAGVGLLLAAIGLYGVVSFLVAERVPEIGVRMALGATPGRITALVLGRAGRWTAAGALLGAAGSWMAARWVQAMLFRVSPHDPWMLAVSTATLAAMALLAAWLPARRAARLDPAKIIRDGA